MKPTAASGLQGTAVHIVDDDSSIRRAIWLTLEAAGYAPRAFMCAEDYLDALDYLPVAPLIVDLLMPRMDGLALLREVKARRAITPVILLTAGGDILSAVTAMKAGALDFLQKPFDPATLLEITAQAAQQLRSDISRDQLTLEAERRIATLSAREREVLACLIAGKSNKVIAFELGLSIRTVEMHRVRMMRRLAVRGLPEALRLAQLAGISAPLPALAG